MPSLLTSLLTPVVDLLWEKVEPKLDQAIDQILALLPLLASAAATGAVTELTKLAADKVNDVLGEGFGQVANDVLKADPDLPFVSDIFDLSETIRNVVNGGTPVGIHIPKLDDLAHLFNRDPQL